MELLKNSIAMQDQMLSCKGFLVIGYSLEKVKKKNKTKQTTTTIKPTRTFLISCLCLIFFAGGVEGREETQWTQSSSKFLFKQIFFYSLPKLMLPELY